MEDYPFELENFDPQVDEVTKEIVEHQPETTDRSIARRSSLQILYEIDSAKHPFEKVLQAHLDERPESLTVKRFIVSIVKGVLAYQQRLDEVIQQYAPEWPIEQVAIVDRNVLRIAVYEFAIQQRAPVPVIINEAVHLAQVFGAENSHSFVHGVLGALSMNLDEVLETLDDVEEDIDDEAELL